MSIKMREALKTDICSEIRDPLHFCPMFFQCYGCDMSRMRINNFIKVRTMFFSLQEAFAAHGII